MCIEVVVTTPQCQSDRCLAKVTQKQQGTGFGHLESSFVLWGPCRAHSQFHVSVFEVPANSLASTSAVVVGRLEFRVEIEFRIWFCVESVECHCVGGRFAPCAPVSGGGVSKSLHLNLLSRLSYEGVVNKRSVVLQRPYQFVGHILELLN